MNKPLYFLFKRLVNVHDDSVLGNPLKAVSRSYDLEELFAEVDKRVRDGCAVRNFFIMQDIPFEMKSEIVPIEVTQK